MARQVGMNRIVARCCVNIAPRVVEAQRAVFAHFGFSIDQRERMGVNHGDFLDAFMTELGEDDVARAQGVEIEMLYPWAAIVPKWRLGDVGLYGVGTFYRGGVFHLFESRWTPFAFLMFDVAEAVLAGREIDYSVLMAKALNTRGPQKWARRFAHWRKAIWWRRLRRRLGG